MSDWRPGASRAALLERAALFRDIRAFFAKREVLEVDTPILARYGVCDPAIEMLTVPHSGACPEPMFLQSSPEFAMKRLLAAGSGPIYQLGKAFRDDEVGKRHNPEFTLLEWYQPGYALGELIAEVAALVCHCLGRRDWQILEYQTLFLDVLGVDPWTVAADDLAALARGQLDVGQLQLDRDGWLDLLMSHCIEPALAGRGLVFVTDYPPSQAALARCVPRGQRVVAERFELYADGMELANGYRELVDADELAHRAAADNALREQRGQARRELDPNLLAAMRVGLPECSGVALGVDRLLLGRLKANTLGEVMPFDWTRC